MNHSRFKISMACVVAIGCMAMILAAATTSLAGQPTRKGPPPKSGQSQKQPRQKPPQQKRSHIRKLPNEAGRRQLQQSIAQQQAERNQRAMALLGVLEHARQERDRRTEDQQQQTESYEQSSEDVVQQALLASGDNRITFRIQNMTREIVHLRFYAINGSGTWPGHDEAYVLDDNKVHNIRLRGRNGEGIAYGAWLARKPTSYWGRGRNNSDDDGTYYKCDGGTTSIIQLND